jgi:HD superfamily phosphohydrolase
MADSLNQNAGKEIITTEERKALGIAGLIHDIGHGPFSHLFEKITEKYIGKKEAHHETWGKRILAEDSQLQKIVKQNKELFNLVQKIFDKLYRPIVADIISSELDADRFDYLLRDSKMTGVHYANLDLTWILRCLVPAEVKILGKPQEVLALDGRRGISVVESYVLGRHYMYKHVYYHKTTRAAEQMLRNALQYATNQIADGTMAAPHPFFKELADKKPSLENYLKLDDFLLLGYIDQWSEKSDDLGKLCARLRQRQIFKTFSYPDEFEMGRAEESLKEIRNIAKEKGFNPDLFVILDDPSDIAIKSPTYLKKKGKESKYQPLYFVEPTGTTTELAQSGSFVNTLNYRERRIHVPEELLNDVKDVWK